MKFDVTRFGRFLSGLGLSSPKDSDKIVFLYQGEEDVVRYEEDTLLIKGAEIREVFLQVKNPKLSFQELEGIIGLSERIRIAGFPPLEVRLSVNGKVTGAEAQPLRAIPPRTQRSQDLLGLPASPGKSFGPCLVLPSTQDVRGKILVMKNSRDLLLLLQQGPIGIILEEGNLLSHASILAREAKIPAVVKVQDATKRLSDGDKVELDGSRGTILIQS